MGGLNTTHKDKKGEKDEFQSMNHQHPYTNLKLFLKTLVKEIPTKPKLMKKVHAKCLL